MYKFPFQVTWLVEPSQSKRGRDLDHIEDVVDDPPSSSPPSHLPLCRYGEKCFRENADHFLEFAHPWKDNKKKVKVTEVVEQPPPAAAPPGLMGPPRSVSPTRKLAQPQVSMAVSTRTTPPPSDSSPKIALKAPPVPESPAAKPPLDPREQFAKEWSTISVKDVKEPLQAAQVVVQRKVPLGVTAPAALTKASGSGLLDPPSKKIEPQGDPVLLVGALSVNKTHGLPPTEAGPIIVAALNTFFTAHPDHDFSVIFLDNNSALLETIRRGVKDTRFSVEQVEDFATYLKQERRGAVAQPTHAVLDCTWRFQRKWCLCFIRRHRRCCCCWCWVFLFFFQTLSTTTAVADARSTTLLELLVQNWKGAVETLTKRALGNDAPETGKAVVIDVKPHRPYGLEMAPALSHLICVASPNVNPAKSQPINDREKALKLLSTAYVSAFEAFFKDAFLLGKARK